MKKAFTIIELLISIIVISLITMIILTAYKHYSDINNEVVNQASFEDFKRRMVKIVKEKKRVYSSLISPQGIIDIDKLYDNKGVIKTKITNIRSFAVDDFNSNNPDFIYINSKYFFAKKNRAVSMDKLRAFSSNNLIKRKQLKFLGLLDLDSNNAFADDVSSTKLNASQSKYLLLLTNKEAITKDGFKFQYKIFSFIDLGNFLFNKLKSLNGFDRNDVLSVIIKRVEYGFEPNIGAVSEQDLGFLKKIYPNENDLEKVKDKWMKERYNIKVFNIANKDEIRDLIENDISNINEITKSLNDWAIIQARRAAYSSIGGNSLDRDYFITCASEGNKNSDAGCFATNPDGNGADVKIDSIKTLKPELKYSNFTNVGNQANNKENIQVFATNSNNGFFVCKGNAYGDCRVEDDNIPELTSVIDELDFGDIKVSYATQIDRSLPDNDSEYILAKGARELFSVTKKTKNNFNFPIFFSNNTFYQIDNSYDFSDSGNDITFKAKLNKPIFNPNINVYINPPYLSEVFTIFPHFIGGYDLNIDDDNKDIEISTNSDFGIYRKVLIPHIF